MAHEARLIDYFSKEIVAQTNNLSTFRSRVNFAVFIGPLALLGSFLFGVRSLPHGIHVGFLTIVAAVGLILSYLTMGWSCASIERHVWRQCNMWRSLIAEISQGNTAGFSPDQLKFKEKLRLGYLVVYGAMVVGFLCVIILISQVQT